MATRTKAEVLVDISNVSYKLYVMSKNVLNNEIDWTSSVVTTLLVRLNMLHDELSPGNRFITGALSPGNKDNPFAEDY